MEKIVLLAEDMINVVDTSVLNQSWLYENTNSDVNVVAFLLLPCNTWSYRSVSDTCCIPIGVSFRTGGWGGLLAPLKDVCLP